MKNPVRLLLRVPVPWVFVLGYAVGLALQFILPHAVLSGRASWISVGVGAGLFALGAVIAGWGLTLFHRASTTTVPGERSERLVTRGPYRLTRNPMYVGLTLAYFGEAGLLRQIWPLAVLPLVLAYLQWTVIPLEEAKLRETFGEEYEAYRGRVRRWVQRKRIRAAFLHGRALIDF
ncbi:MAG: isoprenylcysteine carboxylmethyltransferase family protein [Acidobacteriaceae bacterium]